MSDAGGEFPPGEDEAEYELRFTRGALDDSGCPADVAPGDLDAVEASAQRAALERDLERHRDDRVDLPRSGWIRAIRDALGTSTRELASRVGRSPQRISQVEQAERDRSLTLANLDRLAAGLGCHVEYVLVPGDRWRRR